MLTKRDVWFKKKKERNTVEKVQHVHIIPKRIEDRLTHIALEKTGACS